MPGARLQMVERQMIQRGLAQGLSQAQIARLLGRDASTICREVRRGGGPASAGRGARPRGRPRIYQARRAHDLASRRAKRPKPFRLVGPLAGVVAALLGADWSPQQIAAVLPELYPGDKAMWVSHETIYKSLFVQGRGTLRRELAAHLRTGRTTRKTRGRRGPGAGQLVGMVTISQRPAQAADRAVPGHWEGDLLLGAPGKGAIITLVERASRFVLLAPLPDRHQATTTRVLLTHMMSRLPTHLKASLTWDQGREMAQHATFTLDTGMEVFFCDPHAPWQRGSNENTNGLLRQYWPKGADMRHLTQTHCDEVALRLNTRPRQTLGWRTPGQALTDLLATTP